MAVESLIRLPPGVHFGEGKRPGQAKPIRRSEKQKKRRFGGFTDFQKFNFS